MTQKHQFHRPDLEAADTLATSRQLHHDLQRIISANSVILDVGANRGQFAEEVLQVLPGVRIYSFEPVPEAYEKLTLLSEKHPQVMPVKRAVSLRAGQSTFFVTASDVGSSLLEPLSNQPSQWLTLDKQISVETIRLDNFIEKESLALGGGLSIEVRCARK